MTQEGWRAVLSMAWNLSLLSMFACMCVYVAGREDCGAPRWRCRPVRNEELPEAAQA